MTSPLTANAPNLRGALYALSLAQDVPDANLLDRIVREYPQFADELTDFAIAIAIDALRGRASADAEFRLDPAVASPAVARAMSRFQNRLYAETTASQHRERQVDRTAGEVANPFASLSRQEFRAFAEKLGTNTVFVAKLRDRQIDASTMTPGFRRRVADGLKAPLDVVVAHFAGAQHAVSTHGRFCKADDKPTDGGRQSFADAVRSSGLTEEQQRALLAL